MPAFRPTSAAISRRRVAHALALAAMLPSLLPVPALAGGWRNPFARRAATPACPVEALACRIDRLEEELDETGTIVAKVPDVWGEARLTKYRREIEEQLAKRVDQFAVSVNGTLARRDQAFLASTLALSTVAAGTAATAPTTAQVELENNFAAGDLPDVPSMNVVARDKDGAVKKVEGVQLEPVLALDQEYRYLRHLNELRRISEGDDTSDAPGYALHLLRMPISVIPGDKTRRSYGAEITCTVEPHLDGDLLPQTFRQLVINDLTDQLAFVLTKFLNTSRGRRTIAQYHQLRQTKADVIASIKDQRKKEQAEEVYRVLESRVLPQSRLELLRKYDDSYSADLLSGDDSSGDNTDAASDRWNLLTNDPRLSESLRPTADEWATLQSGLEDEVRNIGMVRFPESAGPVFGTPLPGSDPIETVVPDLGPELNRQIVNSVLPAAASGTFYVLAELDNEVTIPFVPSGRGRNTRYATPPGQVPYVFGPQQLATLCAAILRGAEGDAINGRVLHMTDVATYLRSGLESAYRFLHARPELWDACTPSLAVAVRRHDHAFTLAADSGAFAPVSTDQPIKGVLQPVQVDRSQLVLPTLRARFLEIDDGRFRDQPIGAFAWAVVVQSALLNEQLIDDMQRTASLNGCCLETAPLPYFLPDPPPEARAAFADYVRCRWPVHVFAIDPIAQDQNIADAYTSRRELQLALAVGLASGNLSARNYNQFARQLDLEAETIALNRTVVGFSHGRDTFGWRFYPRFQTPDTESNLKVAMRTLVGAENRDTRLRQRRIEPGRREVTALVLMPSFVPAADLDFRSSWFELTDPDDRRGKLKFAVRHGREINTLRHQAAHCVSACGYRAEDLRLVHRSIDQLERRLPLQTARIQLPYESSLGGFELLAGSTGALAPELTGFYGEPGCPLVTTTTKPEGGEETTKTQVQETTIYVVGDGFSVHETRVIAGNKDVTDAAKIISRQVFQVTIPQGAHVVTQSETVRDPDGGPRTIVRHFVDVHFATPYGVSNHLLVPVIDGLDPVIAAATARQTAEAVAGQTSRRIGETTLNQVRVEVVQGMKEAMPEALLESVKRDAAEAAAEIILERLGEDFDATDDAELNSDSDSSTGSQPRDEPSTEKEETVEEYREDFGANPNNRIGDPELLNQLLDELPDMPLETDDEQSPSLGD